jgi:hypothetical protein
VIFILLAFKKSQNKYKNITITFSWHQCNDFDPENTYGKPLMTLEKHSESRHGVFILVDFFLRPIGDENWRE